MRTLLRSLIRNATVTGTSAALRLDAFILHAAELLPFEQVEIVNAATGERFRTWVEEAPEGSGEVSVNARKGDVVSILGFVTLHEGQTLAHKPRVVTLDEKNRVVSATEM
jgi:aspartate 1-decarboxylase